MKVLLTCPYSFNYRNYVYSGFVEKLLNENIKVYIVLPKVLKNDSYILRLKNKYSGLLFIEEIEQDYTIFEKVLLIIFRAWCFKIQNTKTYKFKKQNLFKIDIKEWMKYHFLSVLLPKNVNAYNKIFDLSKNIIFRSYKITEFVKNIKPDVYVATLHNKYNEGKYIYATENLGIRSIGVIHSWDVITTKGFFPIATDETIFWSKSNMLAYEKYVSPLSKNTKMSVIGVLHFDSYKNKISKNEARAKLKLPKNKKIILYSTSVKRLVPNEENYILNMVNEFKNNKDIFFLIRIHPQAEMSEFVNIPEKGKNFVVDRPERYLQSGLQDKVRFSENTFSTLMLSITSSDLVINVASSMALDSLALNRPVIWLKDDDLVNNYYLYEHIEDVLRTLPINVFDLNLDIKNCVIKYLSKDHEDTKCKFEHEFSNVGSAQSNLIKIINEH